MEIWEKLARAGCPTCGGGGKQVKIGMETGHTYEFACPDCQQDGKPTGRWAWELSAPCECPPCGWCVQLNRPDRCVCHGSGRILKSGDSLLVAAMNALRRLTGDKDVIFSTDYYGRVHAVTVRAESGVVTAYGEGTDALAAAALALKTLAPKS